MRRAVRALEAADGASSGERARALMAAQQALASSAVWQPDNPATHELIAMVAWLRGEGADGGVALDHLSVALRLRPVSPHVWAAFAEAHYRSGDTGPRFEAALRSAVDLGPNEPGVQRTVAFYGLAVFDELQRETRDAVEKAVRAGARRAPEEMLQIGMRRDRLRIVCRHLSGSARQTDPMWLQRCESREAT